MAPFVTTHNHAKVSKIICRNGSWIDEKLREINNMKKFIINTARSASFSQCPKSVKFTKTYVITLSDYSNSAAFLRTLTDSAHNDQFCAQRPILRKIMRAQNRRILGSLNLIR